jgi:hypothetical protein
MHLAGYAIVTLDSVIEAHPMLVGTSVQNTDHVAFTWALQLTAGIQVNIYADSKYAFTIIHVHEAYIKRRVSLIREEKILSMDKKSSNY